MTEIITILLLVIMIYKLENIIETITEMLIILTLVYTIYKLTNTLEFIHKKKA